MPTAARSFRRLRARQAGGYDRDAVAASMCGGSSRDHGGIYELVAKSVTQPAQVTDVVVGDLGCQFGFEPDHLPLGTLGDQVNFVVAIASSQVVHAGIVRSA